MHSYFIILLPEHYFLGNNVKNRMGLRIHEEETINYHKLQVIDEHFLVVQLGSGVCVKVKGLLI